MLAMRKKQYTCTEEVLSRVLFGDSKVIVERLDRLGINPGSMGLENMFDFTRVVPELARCKIGSKWPDGTMEPGDILRTVPDANVPVDGARHSVLVTKVGKQAVTVFDDNGMYDIPKEQIYREWDRTNRVHVRCR